MTDQPKKAKQNPKDPHWLVRYKVLHTVATGLVRPDGSPIVATAEVGEDEITVAASDETSARKFIEQQNPGITVIDVTKAEVQP